MFSCIDGRAGGATPTLYGYYFPHEKIGSLFESAANRPEENYCPWIKEYTKTELLPSFLPEELPMCRLKA